MVKKVLMSKLEYLLNLNPNIMFYVLLKKLSAIVPAFLCVLLLTNISCNSDDSSIPDVTDEPDVPVTTESIVLEENFILDKDKRLLNFVLPATDYDKFLQGEGDFAMVSNKVYEYFNDDFDFIFILSNEDEKPADLYFGVTRTAKNDVEGIGGSLYDNTASFGSQGALKSVIYMPEAGFVRNGPFLHEIVHYWGNKNFISTTVGGHWGFSSVGGQLGGFDELIDLGDKKYQGRLNGRDGFGTFANGGNGLAYGNLELYIMGLIGVDQLEPVQVAENPVSIGSGTFTADNIIRLTGSDLIAQHGARVPSVQNAQKDFKAITVVISRSSLSEAEIIEINSNLENFSRKGAPDSSWGNLFNFWKATGERATLEIDILQANIK